MLEKGQLGYILLKKIIPVSCLLSLWQNESSSQTIHITTCSLTGSFSYKKVKQLETIFGCSNQASFERN